jgi:hypothetical protein
MGLLYAGDRAEGICVIVDIFNVTVERDTVNIYDAGRKIAMRGGLSLTIPEASVHSLS